MGTGGFGPLSRGGGVAGGWGPSYFTYFAYIHNFGQKARVVHILRAFGAYEVFQNSDSLLHISLVWHIPHIFSRMFLFVLVFSIPIFPRVKQMKH